MNTPAPAQQRQHDAPAPLLGGARKQRPAANVGLPLFMQADPGASAVGATLQRQCACDGTSGANDECQTWNSGKRLQAKLTIGASDDPLEREADRVAEQVLAAPSQRGTAHSALCRADGRSGRRRGGPHESGSCAGPFRPSARTGTAT